MIHSNKDQDATKAGPSRIRDAIDKTIESKVFPASYYAQRLDVSQSSMSRFLSGKQGLEFATVEKLFDCLGLDVFDGQLSSLSDLIPEIAISGIAARANLKDAMELLEQKLDQTEDPTPERVANYLGERIGRHVAAEDVRYFDGWAFHWNGSEVDCYCLKVASIYAEPITSIERRESPFRRMSEATRSELVAKLNRESHRLDRSLCD